MAPARMSGHSKWATIKRKKGATDAKRGKLFTKLAKEVQVAARMGGGDPDGNPRLRLAIQAAKSASMPNDNITRAIKKGTGELTGGEILELTYEGYGPGGVAFLVETATDNQNRTVADVRSMFVKAGGSLAKSGAVAFMFKRRGMLSFDEEKFSEDQVMEAALEAGAEDVVAEDGAVIVYCEPNDLSEVQDAMIAAGLTADSAEAMMIPDNSVALDEEGARKIMRLVDRLEDHDDVQHVWANFDIDDALMQKLSEE